MATEIWRFIKEKFSALAGWIKGLFVSLWRYIKGLLREVSGSTWRKIAVGVPVVFVLYIIISIPFVSRIDDQMDIPTSVTAKEDGKRSQTVDMLVYLLDREVNTHNWTPNDPFFMPGAWLDNTPSYQSGMLAAMSRFSYELRDQIGRMRGSSAVDKDLQVAAGHLSKEPTEWIIGSGSWAPRTAADSFYRDAVKSLRQYNDRLSAEEAVFERRSDNLLATLDRIANDIGASSAAQDAYISENAGGFLPDFGVDNEFYEIKGKLYAYSLLLTCLKEDYKHVIEDRDLGQVYNQLLTSLGNAVALSPMIVTNGSPDGVLANHLSIQGFYLQRARTQLKELTNILLK